MIYPWLNWLFAQPLFTPTDNRPPSIYDILDSMLNYDVPDEQKTPVSKLAEVGHNKIFNFNYPLYNEINRDTFETMILNKFLMRRIGFETFTAFQIELNVKLNEIMPKYNKMFQAFINWDIFNDGETSNHEGEDNGTNDNTNTLHNTSNNDTTNISDRRNSNTPQNQLSNVRDGKYVTDYNYDTNTANSVDNSTTDGTSNTQTHNKYWENIKKSPADKISILKDMQDNIESIYTLIFNDLEDLFYTIP